MMIHAARARPTPGQRALAPLERECFQAHFQDRPTKGWLFDTLVRPTAMYARPFWSCDISPVDWASLWALG